MTGNTALRDAILNVLITKQEHNDPQHMQRRDEITYTINHINDRSVLQAIHALCEYVTSENTNSMYGGRTAIEANLDTNGCRILVAAYNNLDAIKGGSGFQLAPFMMLVITLMARDDVETDEQGRITTMAQHLYAYQRYADYPLAKKHLKMYCADNEYISAVQKCPDHVEQVIAYRNERNEEHFDEQDFQRYLSYGVLADGWV